MRKQLIITALLVFLAFQLNGQTMGSLEDKSKVVFSPHNLSLIEPEGNKDDLVFDFSLCRHCHVPNMATPVEPLWYKEMSGRGYDLLTQFPSDDDHVHSLDPGSRNCLFCHDGSVARTFPHRSDDREQQVNLTSKEPSAPANYNTHLFAFPERKMEISKPGKNSPLPLNDKEEISCVTCHDPHDNDFGNFLRVTDNRSRICLECHHMQNWEQSTHGNPQNPLHEPLGEIACLQCHEIHTLPAQAKLLRSDENTLCLSCHDGNQDMPHEVASNHNLQEVFEKPFIHPIRINPNVTKTSSGPDTDSKWNFGMSEDRFVRCSDCHNPHAVSEHAVSPVLSGTLAFVKGVDGLGLEKSPAEFEYEVCYKCHGQNQNVRPGNDVGRLFATGNASFHPVENVGNSPSVPSLKEGWSEQSLITCSDCHGNDDPFGPQGPHGSSLPHILKAEFDTMPFGVLEDQKLCFRCHDQRRIVADTGFKFHNLHIERAGYSCSACHNPHGSLDSPGLIDVNKTYILPVNGLTQVMGTEPGHGTCTLQCHNKKHSGQTY